MLVINQSPTLNSVVLDANNTVISVFSSNGVGYYFRAKIFINGVLFDEQGWSRKDDFTAEKDLKKLYNAYFKTVFEQIFTNGLFEQTHLKSQVSIIVEEKLLSDDSLVDTISLPNFFILYNNKPQTFNQNLKVQFLGVETQILNIPDSGKISIPFFVNISNETIGVELLDNFGTVVDGVVSFNQTGKKTYLYNLDIATLSLANNTEWLILNITTNGGHLISKTIRLMNFPNFSIKEIAFLNNFGYYLYAYLDGQLVIENDLEPKSYTQLDNSEVVYEIIEKEIYTINTGHLLQSEKEITNQIATALKSKINLNNEWIEMVTDTKKVVQFKERNNAYTDKLVFSVKKNSSVVTPLIFNKTLIISNFTKIGQTGNNYKVFFIANFPLTNLFLEHSTDNINWSTPIPIVALTSPQTLILTLTNNEFIRLKDVNGSLVVFSNVYIFVDFSINVQLHNTGSFSDSWSSGNSPQLSLNITNLSNIGIIKWQANYNLVSANYPVNRVRFSVYNVFWQTVYSWSDWDELNGTTPGIHITPIRTLSTGGNPQSPIIFQPQVRIGHSITFTFWIYDLNNNLVGTTNYTV